MRRLVGLPPPWQQRAQADERAARTDEHGHPDRDPSPGQGEIGPPLRHGTARLVEGAAQLPQRGVGMPAARASASQSSAIARYSSRAALAWPAITIRAVGVASRRPSTATSSGSGIRSKTWSEPGVIGTPAARSTRKSSRTARTSSTRASRVRARRGASPPAM